MALATQDLLDGAQAVLVAAFPDLAVELFPARPEDYRLNHPVGALLLAYPGSRFADPILRATSVCQERTLTLGVSLVSRHLWGPDGAVALLDRLMEGKRDRCPSRKGRVSLAVKRRRRGPRCGRARPGRPPPPP